MTARPHRYFTLGCNAIPKCTEVFHGKHNEARAQVRLRAVRAGWTHVKNKDQRYFDLDFCPAHKPEEARDGRA